MASSSKKSAAKANLLGKRKPEDDLPVLRKHKEKSEEKETTKGRVQLLETKSDQANLISVKETVEEGLDDETPDFVEEAAAPKKTLFVGQLSPQTGISDIIDFFKDVGEVVRVRLVVNPWCILRGCGLVEFASANEAKNALQEKNGEYLHDRKIFLATKRSTHPPPKYCIDHKVWYKDYLQRESLPIEKDESLPIGKDETRKKKIVLKDETPAFVEEVLIVANLSPQTTKIFHIINFFQDVGKVVSVRLVVDRKGKNVGYGFVEFASANEAKRALEKKNGEYLDDHKILLMKRLDETPDSVEAAAVRNKTLFVSHGFHQTEISDIINFFKDVGEVVHVRLIVNLRGRQEGHGFVEFASSSEAKKALEKKDGKYLYDRKISLDFVRTSPYAPRPKYCIDHNVRYEDYFRRESLLIEEDAAVEGLDETPDFVEEVAVRNKTVFITTLFEKSRIPKIIKFYKNVGEVLRVRLVVDHRGEHVGCGYVEFASENEAKKALQKNQLCNRKIFPAVAQIAPYPFRPKYDLAGKLWYKDCLRRFSLDLEAKPIQRKQKVFSGKKITFSDDV